MEALQQLRIKKQEEKNRKKSYLNFENESENQQYSARDQEKKNSKAIILVTDSEKSDEENLMNERLNNLLSKNTFKTINTNSLFNGISQINQQRKSKRQMEIASQLKKYLESLKTVQQGEEHMLQIDKKGKNFKMYNGRFPSPNERMKNKMCNDYDQITNKEHYRRKSCYCQTCGQNNQKIERLILQGLPKIRPQQYLYERAKRRKAKDIRNKNRNSFLKQGSGSSSNRIFQKGNKFDYTPSSNREIKKKISFLSKNSKNDITPKLLSVHNYNQDNNSNSTQNDKQFQTYQKGISGFFNIFSKKKQSNNNLDPMAESSNSQQRLRRCSFFLKNENNNKRKTMLSNKELNSCSNLSNSKQSQKQLLTEDSDIRLTSQNSSLLSIEEQYQDSYNDMKKKQSSIKGQNSQKSQDGNSSKMKIKKKKKKIQNLNQNQNQSEKFLYPQINKQQNQYGIVNEVKTEMEETPFRIAVSKASSYSNNQSKNQSPTNLLNLNQNKVSPKFSLFSQKNKNGNENEKFNNFNNRQQTESSEDNEIIYINNTQKDQEDNLNNIIDKKGLQQNLSTNKKKSQDFQKNVKKNVNFKSSSSPPQKKKQSKNQNSGLDKGQKETLLRSIIQQFKAKEEEEINQFASVFTQNQNSVLTQEQPEQKKEFKNFVNKIALNQYTKKKNKYDQEMGDYYYDILKMVGEENFEDLVKDSDDEREQIKKNYQKKKAKSKNQITKCFIDMYRFRPNNTVQNYLTIQRKKSIFNKLIPSLSQNNSQNSLLQVVNQAKLQKAYENAQKLSLKNKSDNLQEDQNQQSDIKNESNNQFSMLLKSFVNKKQEENTTSQQESLPQSQKQAEEGQLKTQNDQIINQKENQVETLKKKAKFSLDLSNNINNKKNAKKSGKQSSQPQSKRSLNSEKSGTKISNKKQGKSHSYVLGIQNSFQQKLGKNQGFNFKPLKIQSTQQQQQQMEKSEKLNNQQQNQENGVNQNVLKQIEKNQLNLDEQQIIYSPRIIQGENHAYFKNLHNKNSQQNQELKNVGFESSSQFYSPTASRKKQYLQEIKPVKTLKQIYESQDGFFIKKNKTQNDLLNTNIGSGNSLGDGYNLLGIKSQRADHFLSTQSNGKSRKKKSSLHNKISPRSTLYMSPEKKVQALLQEIDEQQNLNRKREYLQQQKLQQQNQINNQDIQQEKQQIQINQISSDYNNQQCLSPCKKQRNNTSNSNNKMYSSQITNFVSYKKSACQLNQQSQLKQQSQSQQKSKLQLSSTQTNLGNTLLQKNKRKKSSHKSTYQNLKPYLVSPNSSQSNYYISKANYNGKFQQKNGYSEKFLAQSLNNNNCSNQKFNNNKDKLNYMSQHKNEQIKINNSNGIENSSKFFRTNSNFYQEKFSPIKKFAHKNSGNLQFNMSGSGNLQL
ncbi:hypothetical protein PPERSA_03908 [Pseudocohnilembus persalinus]|uniref:Uncharacterized protein n=1 Tax=Pseudocohnilembus persalinus TaxID=266149 RepID=A0A0V0Q9C7_PSEPJ|nr:hypothetical protein PPERSA_03908 [Pseudocohnilembus persalinus]|eukprot:KRW98773.1 hypothetical protein PPERSA_03908 [Pseudocohnilembus persalinus]